MATTAGTKFNHSSVIHDACTLTHLFLSSVSSPAVVLIHALLYIPPEIDEYGFGTLPETMPPGSAVPAIQPATTPGTATTL